MKFLQTLITIGLILYPLLTACLPAPTQAVCQSINIPINSIVPVLMTENGSTITYDTDPSGNRVIDFVNGQNGGYSEAVFLTPRLNVQGCTHLDISGTSTEEFSLQAVYKLEGGKIVAESGFHPFPSAPNIQTIIVPLKYDGIVEEVALRFHGEGKAANVTIQSVSLK